ncbi:hypothetical protein [Polyangium sp. 15x6]|uniref:hypothetical protein n=1 Tax=Polyangium sp. 15x6 TaxID=3042687 RepID=UPI002499FE76|nr:hypothetical protein [Polyangium sp. 15x6]MDI3285172.1 hypothetical protein [Polyangium sp. 15x6]
MATLMGSAIGALSDEMARAIAKRVQDPADWMLDVRRICEAIQVDPTRCIPMPSSSLRSLCFAVLDEAAKQRRDEEAVRKAFTS